MEACHICRLRCGCEVNIDSESITFIHQMGARVEMLVVERKGGKSDAFLIQLATRQGQGDL